MPRLRQLLIDLSIMAVIGLILALIGPFGSFALPLPVRLVYWLSLALSGYFLYQPIAHVAGSLAVRLDLPEPALWVAACLVATVPMTAVVWTVGQLPHAPTLPTLSEAISAYGYVLVIGAGVTVLFYFINRSKRQPVWNGVVMPPTPVDPVPVPPAPGPRFLDRLPPAIGRDLIALEMEDHYVRAHTVAGSDLILMRMRDAIDELDGIAGAQVHRSWWVARDAVQGMVRQGRNVRLKLKHGLEAPVARAKVSELEAGGWW